MGADFYAVVLFGKIIEKQKSKPTCCDNASGNFCSECGFPVKGVSEEDIYEKYEDMGYDVYDLHTGNKFLVGKELHCINAEGNNPPEQLDFLPPQDEFKVNNDLGDSCQYYIHQHVSI
jgi:hypothetical protein